ncbi:MAG: hypothetical protein JWQ66_1512 [Mucilaginibacter sp.]|nr:hypothetical protein [Mucilaginibacter sp.]
MINRFMDCLDFLFPAIKFKLIMLVAAAFTTITSG